MGIDWDSPSSQKLLPLIARLDKCADGPVSCDICPCRAVCVSAWDGLIDRFSQSRFSQNKKQVIADKFDTRLTEIMQDKTEQVEKQQIKGVVVWT